MLHPWQYAHFLFFEYGHATQKTQKRWGGFRAGRKNIHMTNIAIENHHFQWENPQKIAIFHSKLLDGRSAILVNLRIFEAGFPGDHQDR